MFGLYACALFLSLVCNLRLKGLNRKQQSSQDLARLIPMLGRNGAWFASHDALY